MYKDKKNISIDNRNVDTTNIFINKLVIISIKKINIKFLENVFRLRVSYW